MRSPSSVSRRTRQLVVVVTSWKEPPMRWIVRSNWRKYAEGNSKGPPVRVIEVRREHKSNRSPPPVRRLVLSKVESTKACRSRDKPAEATDVVFRLVKRDSNVHRCGHANSVLEHNKPHTSTGVEAGVEKTVKNVIVWPSTDAGRPGLASSKRTPGNICRCRTRKDVQRVGRSEWTLPVQ